MGSETSSSVFIKSAAKLDQFPDGTKAEVAVLGRSNAGKSTLLNALLKKDIAFVSKTPGKTQLLNFFEFGKRCRLVDFPGYGYAQLGRETSESWQQLIEGYLLTRQNLVGALLLIEIKRPLTEDEINLVNFLSVHDIPFLVLATKIDKLSRAEASRQIVSWRTQIQQRFEVMPISSHSHLGIEELRKQIIKDWVEPWPKSLQ